MICDPNARLHDPASSSIIQEAETKLNIELPTDLKGIYSESNGIFMNSGANTILTIQDMIAKNLEMRHAEWCSELYMPFDNLLFFGEAGNGDLWAFGIKMNGDLDDLNIYGWDHEKDARPWVASNIQDMLVRIGSDNLYDAS
jgi:cell wall assembly regulator SMI1